MSVTSLICTYIYGTFQVICGAIEAYQEMAKGMLEKIEVLAQSLITLWNYSVAKLIETAIDAVRLYQKKLADMIYDPSAQDGAGHNIWCHRLFDCLSFVSELLDPSSLLFKQLDKWFTKQCKENFVNADLFNNIREILSDIQTFQNTVCNSGFTFSFGVETVKQILLGLKKQLLVNRELVNNKIDSIKKMLEQYLEWTFSTGVVDYLNKIEGLIKCIIDDKETTCSSIATSSNYYQNACATMHITKSGDTWYVDPEYKNSTYGAIEGNTNLINDAVNDIDSICDVIVNPDELSKATNAFDLSQNIFPGGISWSDVTTEDKKFSWTKFKSKETWRKNTMVKKFCQTKDKLKAAWDRDRSLNNELFTTEKLAEGLEVDAEGNVYMRDGCDLIPVQPEPLPEPEVIEYFSDDTGSNGVLYDRENDEFLSVTQTALKIVSEPDSDIAKRCEKIWRTIHEWAKNDDTAKKYGTVKI